MISLGFHLNRSSWELVSMGTRLPDFCNSSGLPMKALSYLPASSPIDQHIPACFAYVALVTSRLKVVIWSFEVLAHVVADIILGTPYLFRVLTYAKRNRE